MTFNINRKEYIIFIVLELVSSKLIHVLVFISHHQSRITFSAQYYAKFRNQNESIALLLLLGSFFLHVFFLFCDL